MASNVSVIIRADVVDLNNKFQIAQVQARALTAEFNALAKQSLQMGPATQDFKQKLDFSIGSITSGESKG